MNTAHLILFFFNTGSSPPVVGVRPEPAYTLKASQRRTAIGHVDAPYAFPPQSAGETLNFAFDLDIMLGADETISSVAWQCTGGDAGAAARIQGTPVIFGEVVVQNVGPGVGGVNYKLTATAVTSAGQIIVIYANCMVQ